MPNDSSAGVERIWGGTTLADRRAARRTKLIEAGIELLGGTGPSSVAVRAVCRRAGLTERYFYESFADRQALILAVYEAVAEEVWLTLEIATRSTADKAQMVRAAVESGVRLMVDDPHKGRVLLVAPLAEPALASRQLELAPVLGEMIREQLSPGVSDQERDLIATGLLGAVMSLFLGYVQGTLRVSREEFVDHCVRLLLTVSRLES